MVAVVVVVMCGVRLGAAWLAGRLGFCVHCCCPHSRLCCAPARARPRSGMFRWVLGGLAALVQPHTNTHKHTHTLTHTLTPLPLPQTQTQPV